VAIPWLLEKKDVKISKGVKYSMHAKIRSCNVELEDFERL
jgi:hypothetical protein